MKNYPRVVNAVQVQEYIEAKCTTAVLCWPQGPKHMHITLWRAHYEKYIKSKKIDIWLMDFHE